MARLLLVAVLALALPFEPVVGQVRNPLTAAFNKIRTKPFFLIGILHINPRRPAGALFRLL